MLRNRKLQIALSLVILSIFAVFAFRVFSHCEIPCGIYDDEMRIEMMAEHITTIEKSMNQIMELSSMEEENYNQIVRWVTNKDNHADKLSYIITQYFMTQRIEPKEISHDEEYMGYVEKITTLHKMMYHSMKSKQTTDLEHVKSLRKLLEDFEVAYFGHELGETHQH
ncbi:superoxide dismutase [Candidatus Poribacteria bacterium]|nr:superoxide dismutase [Candidatus Poribacteria bacterium]